VSCREGRIPPPGAGAPLRLPGGQLLVVFTALAILTALAGLLPTRPATRISPTTALGGTE
jgi:putative ABC transport system permease protein